MNSTANAGSSQMSASSVNSSFSSIHNRAASFKASLTNSLTSHLKAQAPVVPATQPTSASTPQVVHSVKTETGQQQPQNGADNSMVSSVSAKKNVAVAMTASAIIRATNKSKQHQREPGSSDVDNYGLDEDSEDEEEEDDDDDDDDDEEIHDATGHNNTDNDADDKILTL